MATTFENLSKSNSDKMIIGICAGLGKHTDIPTWLWRVIFISLIFMQGVGLAAYAALWYFMPPEKTGYKPRPKTKAKAKAKAKTKKT